MHFSPPVSAIPFDSDGRVLFPGAGDASAHTAAAHLAGFAGRSPAVCAAAHRMVALAEQHASAVPPVGAGCNPNPNPSPSPAPPPSARGALAAGAQLQSVLAVALRALDAGAGADPTRASSSASPGTGAARAGSQGAHSHGFQGASCATSGERCANGAGEAVAENLAAVLLTAPRLTFALSAPARAALAEQRHLRPCLAALRRLARAPGPLSGAPSDCLAARWGTRRVGGKPQNSAQSLGISTDSGIGRSV